MTDQAEFNHWMAVTVQYAYISGGADEIREDLINADILSAINPLGESPSFRGIATAILTKARTILGEEENFNSDGDIVMGADEWLPVMQWVLKSIAVVWISRSKPFNHEQLEALADDKIVSGIQGGKSRARRDDLDKIVRKTVFWGIKELEDHP